jgi:hypothetical protein
VAKLVARLLAMTALEFKHPSKVGEAKEWPTHTSPPKNIQKSINFLMLYFLTCLGKSDDRAGCKAAKIQADKGRNYLPSLQPIENRLYILPTNRSPAYLVINQ